MTEQTSHGDRDKARTLAPGAGVRPFEVAVPPERVERVVRRVRDAVLPKQMPPANPGDSLWETGMDLGWLDDLRRYWVERYDWEAAQNTLNRFPQFVATVEGIDVHFYHVRGVGPSPRPLLLSHGWPGSVVEFLDLVEPLTDPARFGGDPADAFTVVIPSLPGFGFSGMPARPINARTTAEVFHRLMTEVLDHPRYVAHGGDFGGGITVQLAHLHPETVSAIHLNFVPWFPISEEDQTPEEREWLAEGRAYAAREFDYMRLQANKPMMPAVALVDSPLGTAAWIAEKFWAWTDNKGDLDAVIPRDKLITNIMLYLVNDNGIDGSLWFYRGFRDEMGSGFFPGYVAVPTAVAVFPAEYPMCRPSEETLRRGFNVLRYSSFSAGGHFAALERPDALVGDLRAAFRSIPR